MEMTLFDFILGLVGLFFVCVPALGLLFYIFHLENKKAKQQQEELRIYRQNVLNSLQLISDKLCCACNKVYNFYDEEEE